jgi:uncharacterized protein (DUF2235 family)
MQVYEEGDRIFLFGFSRGALTVRALEGFIHMFGLLNPGNDGMILYLARRYARRTRQAGGMKATFEVAASFKATFARDCMIHFVGLWDAVGSVGFFRDSIKLPYTGRSPNMVNGRHAVSIDERRCFFRNISWGASLPGQNIKEVWFAGVHSDIGGSYFESGLSQITLQWMLQEATSLGLLVDEYCVSKVLGSASDSFEFTPNPAQRIHNSLIGWWWILEWLPNKYFDWAIMKTRWRIPRGITRMIPSDAVIHESVIQKMCLDPTYRPSNLPPGWENMPEPWTPEGSSGPME